MTVHSPTTKTLKNSKSSEFKSPKKHNNLKRPSSSLSEQNTNANPHKHANSEDTDTKGGQRKKMITDDAVFKSGLKAEKKAKRVKPISKRGEESEEDEEDEEDDWEEEEGEYDEGEGEDGDDLEEGDGGGEGDGVHPDSNEQKSSMTARESHLAQKALQASRKASKPNASLLAELKRLWSLVMQKRSRTKSLATKSDSNAKNERRKHVQELMSLMRGKVQELVFKHDASRIVQAVVRYGGPEQREEVMKEMKGRFVEAAQRRYSKFLVLKFIRLSPVHRLPILLELDGRIPSLLLHRDASSVIADFYELHANPYERALLLRNFYGKEVGLFESGFDKLAPTEEQKDEIKQGLKGVLAKAGTDTGRKKRILDAVKENLLTIFNNPEKGAATHMIVHRVLWEYLMGIQEHADEAEREKARQEIFDSCQDVLADMIHTKDGSRAVREFIARGNAKDRKQIVKALKPNIEKICKDDEAQLVYFTTLDVIDDTKLLSKSLLSSISPHFSLLLQTAQGRRSLLYPIVPRSLRHFTPAQIALISDTDAARNQTSKKDNKLREEEIRKAASEWMITSLEGKEKMDEILRDPGGSLVVCEVMLYADGDKTKATESLLTLLTEPYPSPTDTTPHIIDIPHASRVYKALLQGGHFSKQTRVVEPSERFSASSFASRWLEVVGKDVTVAMAKGTGAFVVAALCDRIKVDGSDEEKVLLKKWFGKGFKEALKGSEVKGRDVLLESLASLNEQK